MLLLLLSRFAGRSTAFKRDGPEDLEKHGMYCTTLAAYPPMLLAIVYLCNTQQRAQNQGLYNEYLQEWLEVVE